MPAKSRQEKPAWFRTWLFKSALLLALVVLFLGAVILAGHWGLEQLRGRERYDISLADIECEPPVGMDRKTFLGQVRYYAPTLPERVNLLDEQLSDKLREGFAKHPWVENVTDVEIKPPRQVVVKLTHRTPALAVKLGADVFAVDRGGVLLPKDAPTLGLPIFEGDAREPKGVGLRWGDPNVEAAARKVSK
jgi:hypothetical protein